MKTFESVISKICVVTSIMYVLIASALVIAQAGSLMMLNGELSVAVYSYLAKPAGYFAAVTALLSIALGYCRGEMKS
ncbi:hypothetical protein [Faecalispora anaeroviscerum]|uniref:hypothetical protein n=1 Tax=Faecalispora anaeroviscerum TaxID=2991836 RepID=UPI0024B987D7|nr:hypothetical protein [Faecalispora anaeroviscerum]